MKADGSDVYPLSFHETHEWHPSVNNDGMIVYTRWDYVDRSDMVAHHIWTCFPDGRDPRSPHGNYPLPRHRQKKARPTDSTYRKMGKYMFGFSGYKRAHYSAVKPGGTRTTPGKFGSGASELTQYLFPKHYEVKLTKGEFRRITMWLDMNSNELGAYHDVEGQRAGKRVWPRLDCDPKNPQGILPVIEGKL